MLYYIILYYILYYIILYTLKNILKKDDHFETKMKALMKLLWQKRHLRGPTDPWGPHAPDSWDSGQLDPSGEATSRLEDQCISWLNHHIRWFLL